MNCAEPGSPLLAGHPFHPTGRGECVRAAFRALRAAGITSHVVDIYGPSPRDPDIEADIGPHLAPGLGGGINIFFINGDEISQALSHLNSGTVQGRYNVIVPMWELSRYPAPWARQVERFDEVWALSRFIRDSLDGRVSIPVHHLPLASQAHVTSFVGRRHFNIPEDPYVFLFLFDFTSYVERKNPFAGLAAFERLLRLRPRAEVHFVIKVSGAQRRPAEFQRFEEAMTPWRERTSIINRILGDSEMRNLIRCCDCFLSLHRSEGLGRGLAEAMFLGKPVIATAYSGNMDFMTPDNSLLVDYRLIPVAVEAYPFWQDQVWADADVEQATGYMTHLIDDPSWGRGIGGRGSRHMRQFFSYRSSGLRYRARLEEIARTR
jgi:glycosyltransferase involved in cell wall biosynthesis